LKINIKCPSGHVDLANDLIRVLLFAHILHLLQELPGAEIRFSQRRMALVSLMPQAENHPKVRKTMIYHTYIYINISIYTGWWYTYPSEKY